MADLTDIWTAEGWLLVANVIDVFSRRVFGCHSGHAEQQMPGFNLRWMKSGGRSERVRRNENDGMGETHAR